MVSCAGSIRNVPLWLFSFFASDDIFLSPHAIQIAISWLVNPYLAMFCDLRHRQPQRSDTVSGKPSSKW